MRDIDIVKDIEIREVQISKLQEEISALKKVAEIYGLNGQSSSALSVITPIQAEKTIVSRGFGESKFAISVGDASEQVLRDKPQGLHLDEIHRQIALMGVTPTRTSLDSALRNDRKKNFRFKLLGKRIWTLKENYKDI